MFAGLVLIPVATLMLGLELTAISATAANVAADPHRTWWRIGLFCLIAVAISVGLPMLSFLAASRRGLSPLRCVNWFAGTAILLGWFMITGLLFVSVP